MLLHSESEKHGFAEADDNILRCKSSYTSLNDLKFSEDSSREK